MSGGGFGAKVDSNVQRKMQTVSLKKTGLGTPAISGSGATFCTVTDNGVGDYTINLSKIPLAQIPEVKLTSSTSGGYVYLGTVTALAVQVLGKDFANVAKEMDFHIEISGSLARDLIG